MRELLFISFFLNCIYSNAQIPNFSFETWTSVSGYPDPTGWDNLNKITAGTNTCLQGSPGSPGSYYLLMITQNVPGKGIVPGKAVSGKIDTTTYLPVSGFAFTSRPAQLNYNMQYMPYSSTDPSSVAVWLTKWDTITGTRDTIASGYSKYAAMAHSWFASYTMLNYYSGNNPDTACIVISSSDSIPMAGSYIYIDNLQFSGSVIGIQGVKNNGDIIDIFPNPATAITEVKLLSAKTGTLVVYNSAGGIVINQNLNKESNIIHLNGIQSGVYFFHIETDQGIYHKKIIVK